jgi:stage V sporulation protein R
MNEGWEAVRDQLIVSRVNGRFPYIVVQDGDYLKNGELYLKHSYETMELDVKYVEKVMPYIYQLWGRGVHLGTNIENKSVLFSYDGKIFIGSIFKTT